MAAIPTPWMARWSAAPDKAVITKDYNVNLAEPAGYIWKSNNDGTSSLAKAASFACSLTLQENIDINF